MNFITLPDVDILAQKYVEAILEYLDSSNVDVRSSTFSAIPNNIAETLIKHGVNDYRSYTLLGPHLSSFIIRKYKTKKPISVRQFLRWYFHTQSEDEIKKLYGIMIQHPDVSSQFITITHPIDYMKYNHVITDTYYVYKFPNMSHYQEPKFVNHWKLLTQNLITTQVFEYRKRPVDDTIIRIILKYATLIGESGDSLQNDPEKTIEFIKRVLFKLNKEYKNYLYALLRELSRTHVEESVEYRMSEKDAVLVIYSSKAEYRGVLFPFYGLYLVKIIDNTIHFYCPSFSMWAPNTNTIRNPESLYNSLCPGTYQRDLFNLTKIFNIVSVSNSFTTYLFRGNIVSSCIEFIRKKVFE